MAKDAGSEDTAKALAANLKLAKTRRMYFALIPKSTSAGVLLLDKKKVPTARVAATKKESGGKTAIQGVCHYEDGQLIFETLKPPSATWAALVKRLAREQAGVTLKAEFRQSGDLPEFAGEPPDGDEVSETDSPPPAPTAPPVSAAPAPSPPVAPDLTAELTRLTPQLQRALAAAPDKRDELLKQVAKVKDDIKAGPADRATASLASLKELLERLTASPPPTAPTSPAASAPASNVLAELAQLAPQIQRALGAAPDKREVILKLVAKVKDDAKAGPAERAAAALAALRQALERLTASSATPPASLAALRVRWREARETVGAGLSQLQAALRGDPDPRMKRIGDMGLHGITGRLQVGLEVALIEAENAPAARAKAAMAVADFRQFLEKEPLVRLVDQNPFKVPVNLRTTLGPALEDLEKALSR